MPSLSNLYNPKEKNWLVFSSKSTTNFKHGAELQMNKSSAKFCFACYMYGYVYL